MSLTFAQPAVAPAVSAVGTACRWDCECIACCHRRYGCLVCGDRTGRCTPTACVAPPRA